ncbi:UDP-glucuronosyl/UDP-glucosyltransferase [Cinara cedri]|uniref:UDP-glucuronosyltransferase n=1 Tax=Cinara cedri TaxID=506608 RepID=A0A5E4M0N5_9HEMI|nr:UDP-glucuronosyl/UDP-glucosyltransferase [Cinara cedri]
MLCGDWTAAVVLLVTSCLTRTTTTAHRILAYEPCAGSSHWNVMSAVLESLVDAGHEVVCLTMHRAAERLAGHPNYTYIDITALTARPEETARDLDYGQVMKIFRSNAFMIGMALTWAQRLCETLDDVPAVRRLFDGTDGGRPFDAVVMESLHSECQSALPGRLGGVPVFYVVPCPFVDWMPTVTGSPDHPSYLGGLLTDRPTPDSFGQRLHNAAVYVHTNFLRWYLDVSADAVRWPRPRDAVVFVNTHYSVEPARPLGPNVVEIGGIHLRPPEPIPQDIADVMDKSGESGVVVFSLGSLVAVDSLPDDVLAAFKFAFSRLSQTVIWKYENDHMPDKPKNVVLCKWLPQRAILKHPNVKLFISHGGMNGVYEAVDAGVPVLGLPLFYDQPRNVQNLVDIGMALSLNIDKISKTTLLKTVNRLLDEQSFSENAKRVSSLFQDRPMKPADSVVYWVEYFIRHGVSANIRPLSADATWTSHFMLDLLVVFAGAVIAVWFCSRLAIFKTLNKCLPSK